MIDKPPNNLENNMPKTLIVWRDGWKYLLDKLKKFSDEDKEASKG